MRRLIGSVGMMAALSGCGPDVSGDQLTRVSIHGVREGEPLEREDDGTAHLENDADVTLSVLACSEEEIADFGAVRVDEKGRIAEFREKPGTPEAREGMQVAPELLKKTGLGADRPYLASMGIYLFKKDVLRACLDNDLTDFGNHVIPQSVTNHQVQAHFFDDYWRDIGTTRAFFDAHMDLVKFNPPFSFHDRDWPIYTRPRHLPGARLDDCCFTRVLLGDGSKVVSSKVEDSVIGLRANIGGAILKRTLVMGVDSYSPDAPANAPPVGIGEGSLIQGAIIDLNARIGRNVRLINKQGIREAEGDTSADDFASRFDLDFSLMTLELAAFLPQLLDSLGGEAITEAA